MSHSTKDFILGADWFEEFHSAYLKQGRLFLKRDFSVVDTRHPVDLLLRTNSSVAPKNIIAELERPLSLVPINLARQFESLNLTIGEHFAHRCGYRNKPLLVISHLYPWATFFSPINDARRYVEGHLQNLLDNYKSLKLSLDLVASAVALIMVVDHPFFDCNGRTIRIMLFKFLKNNMRMPVDAALHYANMLSSENSSFIVAMWEVRERRNYEYYLNLFA